MQGQWSGHGARVWVWPDSELLASAVRSGGGSVVTLEQANAIVCTDDVELLRRSILPGIRWVQLGAEPESRCGSTPVS